MKKIKIILIVSLLVNILFTVGAAYYFTTDSPISFVRSIMPLGKAQSYTIKESEQLTKDGLIIPAGATYEIVMDGDDRNLDFLGPGRSVGFSKVDIKPYLNKKVYIHGSIDEGARYWKDHHETIPDEPLYRGGIVVNIDSIESAE